MKTVFFFNFSTLFVEDKLLLALFLNASFKWRHELWINLKILPNTKTFTLAMNEQGMFLHLMSVANWSGKLR